MIDYTIKRKSKYEFNSNVLLNNDDTSYYLLGAYMTDGCISTRKHHRSFSIASMDTEWIEAIRDLLSPTKPIFESKKYNIKTLENSNDKCMNWLISYGCTPNKSKTLKIEKEIPEQYYRDFIRGAVDGDGSINYCDYNKYKNGKTYTYKKTSVYICSASEQFLLSIKDMIPKNINCQLVNCGKRDGGTLNGRKVIATCNNYRLCFNDSYAKLFLQWIYYPDHKISMKRKRDKSMLILGINL